MVQKKQSNSKASLVRLVWSNVIRQQYLFGITDEQLCEVLGVTTRTLLNYRHDASHVTIQQLQSVIEAFNLEPEALFRA